MALKVKDEFVGKRFICFEKSLKNTLQACNGSNDFENGILKLENLELKRGIIRAITSKDLNEESHQILVEFDNKPWETREWLTTADQLCLLMVEDSLAWIPRDKCCHDHNSQTENEDGKNSTQSHLPALVFRKVFGDIRVEEGTVVVELLQSRKLIFHLDPAWLLPFKEDHLKRENGLCQDGRVSGEVEKWWDVQNGQNILLNMPLILVGFRVRVYRTQGTTQWFTAVIRTVDENSQMLIVLDDTVLEEHHVSPSLVQMSLIGEGVVTSLLNGDHVKIRPSRTKNTTNSKNLSNNLEKKRKNSVVRDHPKKRKTRSPIQIPKPEANVEYSGLVKASGKLQSHPQLDIKEKVGICIAEDLLRPSQRFNDFKTCRRDNNNGRSLFKQVKQKFSSSSSSSFSSSSSSSSSESSESSFKGLDRKISNPVNKINTSNTKALNNVEQCKLAICSQKLDSTTNLISNSLASSKKSLGKLEKIKKSKEKGVIFLTEEEEEFIHNTTCIASPENIIQGKRIFQKTTSKKFLNSGAMQSDKKEFLSAGRAGDVTDDVPVDLSSPASCADGRGKKKMDNSQANLASEPCVSTSGLPSKPVQTVFPTISPQDKTDGAICNFGDKPTSVAENISCPLTYGLIDQSARNLIPLGYIPFLPLLNGSVKMVANPSDRSKPGSDVALPTERVTAFGQSVRLQLLPNADEIHKTHALKTIKTIFPGRCDSGLTGKGEVPGMVRDEKNVRLERKEPKFIVHEPEKPGEAVNHHFSKSLQVRHPAIGPQSTIVQGMMLCPMSMSPQTQSPSLFIKSSSPHHGHTAVFNPHARPDNSSKANAWSSHYFGSESNSIYSVPKPKSCMSNVSSYSSAESLKPTLDLSGNVYLPSVSMLKSPPDAPLTKLQQDQLQEYLKLHAQQFHQLQQQAILPARNQYQSQGNTSQVNSITSKDETLTQNLLLLSKKFLSNSNIISDSALSQSKVEISPGVLDLQKKQNFSMSANVVSKSNQRPPSMQFWNDKVPPQEQQALLSNSIIVVDYQGLKDRGIIDRSTPSDASRSLSDNFNFADSLHGETSVIARGNKRSSGEAPPPMHVKKLRISDGFMDVTSLLFCGSERKVTSPQLGLLPQSSSLAHNRLQNCFRATTPDIPSARSLSKEERIVNVVYAEGGSTSGSVPRREDVKREKLMHAADCRRVESVRTDVSIEMEATTVPSSSAFSEVRHLSGPSADSFLPTLVNDGSCRRRRDGDPEISYDHGTEESLPPTLSASSLKCISSPDSSRDNAIGTDSETRSACSPLMIRSIGGTPTFTSSEVNDSSLAVRSSSVCSSNAPVKFKKAWLKRYDEDSRNDSSSSTENISLNGHAKLIDGSHVANCKSEVGASKPYDISHQDIMTPSTSAVEDSNDGWTSENEDEEKSVASQHSGACVQDLKPQPRKDSEKGSYECIEKMKGRLRELRVASKRDDPSAILSSQVLNRTSKEKRSETLEPFLQDGSCHEVTPRLIKCRECRTMKNKKDRKAPNDFCRFYAFRRLRYISKRHLTVSGFSDLNDVTVPDMELWFPTIPIVGPSLDREVASYLLLHLREPFAKIVKLERMAETWCRKSIFDDGSTATVWKRAVQGVKEMCDVCDVALFNIHCVCTKCGFAVCISCHKEKVFQMKKMKMLTAENASEDKIDHFDFSEDSPPRQDALKTKKCKNQRQDDPSTLKSCNEEPADRWLTCHNKQQLHDPHKLMVAQTIPSDVLWFLEELLERYLEVRASSGTRANSLPFLSSAFDRLAVLADVAEKQIQNDENQLESKNQPCIPQNSPFVEAKKLQEINLRGKDAESMGPTSNGIKFQGKCTTMLQKERLLHVTDASSSSSGLFLSNFQEHWAKGLPIVASKCNLDMDLWRPDLLYRTLSRSDPNHLDSFSDAVTCRRFWEGFEKVSARVKHNEYGLVNADARLSPVFTWGSSKDEFRDTLPHQFQNLVESLPLRAYTSESGRFNLTSRLPDFFAKPDLGPRLHVGYGQLDTFEGSLPLKLEGCDVVTLLACVVTPKDDVNNHLSAAEKYLMKIGCGLKLSDTATKPGVVWHVFERQHNDVIEKLIVEKQMKASQDGSAIKSSVYLNVDDLKILKRDRNVEPITVVQHLDDAVFIPTGCYHQARFLYGCVMASLDVVTPENTSFMLEHQLKAHFNCSDKLQLLNTIYHATKDSLAVAMQSEMLSHCH